MRTPKVLKIILSGFIAAIVSAGGALIAALSAMPADTQLDDVGSVVWVISAMSGLVSAGKDWQSQLSEPK